MRRSFHRKRTAFSLVVATWFVVGCGYFMAGEWDDDPRNFQRVFGTKPSDVVVVHSHYWRSPHWTYEAAFVFSFAPNPRFRDELFQKNRFARVDGWTKANRDEACFPGCPIWFAPKAIDQYDVWKYADEPKNNFRMLIDRTTGEIFMTAYQV